MTPKSPPTHKLSRREREIMNAVFALSNTASADAIRARLVTPPSYSAVRAMLARLERKGYLKHQQDGGRYIYSATRSHAAAGRDALREYLRVFFDGSLERMMTSLIRRETWSSAELDALESEIERVRRERKA
jgi:BlaI family penicillinase repressor